MGGPGLCEEDEGGLGCPGVVLIVLAGGVVAA